MITDKALTRYQNNRRRWRAHQITQEEMDDFTNWAFRDRLLKLVKQSQNHGFAWHGEISMERINSILETHENGGKLEELLENYQALLAIQLIATIHRFHGGSVPTSQDCLFFRDAMEVLTGFPQEGLLDPIEAHRFIGNYPWNKATDQLLLQAENLYAAHNLAEDHQEVLVKFPEQLLPGQAELLWNWLTDKVPEDQSADAKVLAEAGQFDKALVETLQYVGWGTAMQGLYHIYNAVLKNGQYETEDDDEDHQGDDESTSPEEVPYTPTLSAEEALQFGEPLPADVVAEEGSEDDVDFALNDPYPNTEKVTTMSNENQNAVETVEAATEAGPFITAFHQNADVGLDMEADDRFVAVNRNGRTYFEIESEHRLTSAEIPNLDKLTADDYSVSTKAALEAFYNDPANLAPVSDSAEEFLGNAIPTTGLEKLNKIFPVAAAIGFIQFPDKPHLETLNDALEALGARGAHVAWDDEPETVAKFVKEIREEIFGHLNGMIETFALDGAEEGLYDVLVTASKLFNPEVEVLSYEAWVAAVDQRKADDKALREKAEAEQARINGRKNPQLMQLVATFCGDRLNFNKQYGQLHSDKVLAYSTKAAKVIGDYFTLVRGTEAISPAAVKRVRDDLNGLISEQREYIRDVHVAVRSLQFLDDVYKPQQQVMPEGTEIGLGEQATVDGDGTGEVLPSAELAGEGEEQGPAA